MVYTVSQLCWNRSCNMNNSYDILELIWAFLITMTNVWQIWRELDLYLVNMWSFLCPASWTWGQRLQVYKQQVFHSSHQQGKWKSFTQCDFFFFFFTYVQRSRLHFNNKLFCTHQMYSMMLFVHPRASLPALVHSSTIVCFLSFLSALWLKEADGVKTHIQCFLCWPWVIKQ